ncbi:unnamed protein product [Didymodactylos carnosus]|uniref:Uncharacterized protein n=1 Tax=Didymodactylos carnosus TaxID=1234261 RepID=A0A814BMD5_9BILA|nr:unnamed protein product [Didymodactylos carnosus]CAF3706995.1 unnamed protein product [Didymodactylos carnosus]
MASRNDQTLYVQKSVWNRRQFKQSKSALKAAKRLIITNEIGKETKDLRQRNSEIRHEIDRHDCQLKRHQEKLEILDNMTQLASQSLETYFDKRMENLRTFVDKRRAEIIEAVQEEADHWKEIHALLNQKLLIPGDVRSYKTLPRAVKQSPSEDLHAIDEEEDEDNVSQLLNSQTLTPLLNRTLRKTRLRLSKLATEQLPQLNISESITDQSLLGNDSPSTTIIEENELQENQISSHENLVMSKVENERYSICNNNLNEESPMNTNNHSEIQQEPLSTVSTSSSVKDKTFFIKSVIDKDETEEEQNDDTIQNKTTLELDECSNPCDKNDRQSLLLTADRSIRIHVSETPPVQSDNVKQEKSNHLFFDSLSSQNDKSIHSNNTEADETLKEPIPFNDQSAKNDQAVDVDNGNEYLIENHPIPLENLEKIVIKQEFDDKNWILPTRRKSSYGVNFVKTEFERENEDSLEDQQEMTSRRPNNKLGKTFLITIETDESDESEYLRPTISEEKRRATIKPSIVESSSHQTDLVLVTNGKNATLEEQKSKESMSMENQKVSEEEQQQQNIFSDRRQTRPSTALKVRTDDSETIKPSVNKRKTFKSPPHIQDIFPDKRRTRRTVRPIDNSDNENVAPAPQTDTKVRYQTRYSTRRMQINTSSENIDQITTTTTKTETSRRQTRRTEQIKTPAKLRLRSTSRGKRNEDSSSDEEQNSNEATIANSVCEM